MSSTLAASTPTPAASASASDLPPAGVPELDATAWCELARTHADAGCPALARDTLIECLSRYPHHVPGFLQLGGLLLHLGFALEGTVCLQQAAALTGGATEEHLRLAQDFAQARQHLAAIECYRVVLAWQPDNVAVLNNLGLSLAALGRDDEAEAAYRAALELAPTIAELHGNLAGLLQRHDALSGAMTHYREALASKPDWPEAWNNLGVVARALGEEPLAEQALREALRLNPTYVEAHYNLGNALGAAGRKQEACACYETALTLRPTHAEALYNLANLTEDLAAAGALCERLLRTCPEFPEALVALATARLKACDWNGVDALCEQVSRIVQERPDVVVSPLNFLQINADPGLHLQCARNWVRNRVAPVVRRHPSLPPPTRARAAQERLTLGYLSSDFRNHAVGNLIVDLFAQHDRTRYRLVGYSTGPDDGSETRRRVAAALDCFVDVRGVPAYRLAQRIRSDGVDILVDLSGYTEHSQSEALAFRPAPVQLSYLGFPGSMGASFVDYILTDHVLTPPGAQRHYDERLAALPRCYQVNPPPYDVPARSASLRAAHGLPGNGFVFCCFNNGYKIRPQVFAIWMDLLMAAPGSVLWLAQFSAPMQTNLQREARARGVDSARLVFAPIVTPQAHLARLPAADLFLDTYPYSAGATASQTLLAGVPLLTVAGEAYVSRMAASLLTALGLPELVTGGLDEYKALALALSRDRDRRLELRDRLIVARDRSDVFNPSTFASDLESAYELMWKRWLDADAPAPIQISRAPAAKVAASRLE